MADLHKGAEGDVASFRTAALREYKPLAEQGVALAQFFLGLMYEEGLGVAQDAAQAAEWFRKAAK
ncbi:MAG: SEL1-like repeat protein, partial [Alphaproteobacteria bacterium]|nr:SEL1-like repeat protein [Alphaproteobacteria bacterium]